MTKKVKKRTATGPKPKATQMTKKVKKRTATGPKPTKATRALVPLKEKRRSPVEQRAMDKAAAETEHNNKVLHEVWAGRKGRSALMHEDEGGELKRVGWPDGYDPKKDPNRTRRAAVAAHSKLFTESTDAPAKRGRPNGAVTRGNGSYTGKKIVILAKENPKKAGSKSYDEWKLYENNMPVEKFFEKGGRTASLKWDSEHGFIELQ